MSPALLDPSLNECNNTHSSPTKENDTLQDVSTNTHSLELNEQSIDSFDNVLYDEINEAFYTGRFDSNLKRYLDKTQIVDVSLIDPQLIQESKSRPNTWVSLPLGDSRADSPPVHLCTNVKCLYEQHEKPYCVTYCAASALFYCGFDLQARDLAAQAPLLAPLCMNSQLDNLRTFLPNLVPLIGGVTVFGKRCAGNNKKKRSFSWEDLFTDMTPYPILVVAARKSNGRMTHAFCVVDDLIFDSSSSFALKLTMESINWIFMDDPVDLFVAYRFNQKVSPEGHRVRGKCNRLVQCNWTREESDTHPIDNKAYDVEYAHQSRPYAMRLFE